MFRVILNTDEANFEASEDMLAITIGINTMDGQNRRFG